MAGGEVLRLLSTHPEIEVKTVTAESSAGKRLGELQPHLPSLADLEILPTDAAHLRGHDVIFFALPHGASGALTAELAAAGDGALMVDCGADHRLTSAAAWEEYYGSPAAEPWTYGMPELLHAGETQAAAQRAALRQTRTIAVPGCNVTAITLALQPGVAAGLVDASAITATAAVGYSGAGKSLKPHLMACSALGNAKAYSVGGTHRHIPEIIQNFTAAGGEGVRLNFTPILVPMSRGILANVTAPLAAGVSPEDVRAAWEAAYGPEPVITLEAPGAWPETIVTAGSGAARVGVGVDRKAGVVIAQAAIDNLGKGTASAAIQSTNLALGLPELTGVALGGINP